MNQFLNGRQSGFRQLLFFREWRQTAADVFREWRRDRDSGCRASLNFLVSFLGWEKLSLASHKTLAGNWQYESSFSHSSQLETLTPYQLTVTCQIPPPARRKDGLPATLWARVFWQFGGCLLSTLENYWEFGWAWVFKLSFTKRTRYPKKDLKTNHLLFCQKMPWTQFLRQNYD